jgi:hypothetical protein
MTPNSDNTSHVLITREPDWAEGVVSTFTFETGVFVSRSGKEQRKRGRATPKAKIIWKVSGLTLPQYRAAIASAAVEARALCRVPFWSEGTITVTSISSNAVTIGVDPRADFFAVGQWVYFVAPAATSFRRIASVSGRILTLDAAPSEAAIPSGARCYPCRVCRRIFADQAIERTDSQSHNLTLEYQATQ